MLRIGTYKYRFLDELQPEPVPARLANKAINQWTQDDVIDWLEHVKLRPILPQMQSHSMDGDRLLHLDEPELAKMRIPVSYACATCRC